MEELLRTRDRLLGVAGMLVGCLAAGTCGYRFIEGWPWSDALYMTVITVGTVGYGEVHPLSAAGRAFTMVLILGGIGLFTYGFSTIAAIVIEGDLSEGLRRRRMEKKIEGLSGHYVVCGAGHAGGVICTELRQTGRDFVVIDRDAAAIERLSERLGGSCLSVVGDGSEDRVLRRAGVERAAGVFAVLATDQDNAFVALSAKGLNPKARVLACQRSLGVREKLLRSGADGVVEPEFIGGLRLASEMVRPVTVGFLDSMLRETGAQVRFEEVAVPAGSSYVGKPVGEVKGAEGGGPLLVALLAPDSDRFEINPSLGRALGAGDRLVVIGEAGAIQALRQRLQL